MIRDGVAEDAVKPRHDTLAAPQRRTALQRSQKTLLQEIVRLRGVAESSRQETMKRRPFRDQRVDRVVGKSDGISARDHGELHGRDFHACRYRPDALRRLLVRPTQFDFLTARFELRSFGREENAIAPQVVLRRRRCERVG